MGVTKTSVPLGGFDYTHGSKSDVVGDSLNEDTCVVATSFAFCRLAGLLNLWFQQHTRWCGCFRHFIGMDDFIAIFSCVPKVESWGR